MMTGLVPQTLARIAGPSHGDRERSCDAGFAGGKGDGGSGRAAAGSVRVRESAANRHGARLRSHHHLRGAARGQLSRHHLSLRSRQSRIRTILTGMRVSLQDRSRIRASRRSKPRWRPPSTRLSVSLSPSRMVRAAINSRRQSSSTTARWSNTGSAARGGACGGGRIRNVGSDAATGIRCCFSSSQHRTAARGAAPAAHCVSGGRRPARASRGQAPARRGSGEADSAGRRLACPDHDTRKYAHFISNAAAPKGITEEEAAEIARTAALHRGADGGGGRCGRLRRRRGRTQPRRLCAPRCSALDRRLRCALFRARLSLPCRIVGFGHDGLLAFADCSIVIDPSPGELADIAIATAATTRDIIRRGADCGAAVVFHQRQRPASLR